MKQSYSYTYTCLHINTYTVTCTISADTCWNLIITTLRLCRYTPFSLNAESVIAKEENVTRSSSAFHTRNSSVHVSETGGQSQDVEDGQHTTGMLQHYRSTTVTADTNSTIVSSFGFVQLERDEIEKCFGQSIEINYRTINGSFRFEHRGCYSLKHGLTERMYYAIHCPTRNDF